MRFLVTGGHGFIGSHLCERLLASGHEVRALVTPWGKLDNLAAVSGKAGLEVVRGDVTRPQSLAGLAEGFDAVIHTAARVADWGPEEGFVRTNVEGTRNMLDVAAADGARRFVLVSSVAVHRYTGFRNADPEAVPRNNTDNAYSRSKIAAEDLVFGWTNEGVVVRPGLWPFGTRDPTLRRVAAALLEGRMPLVAGGRRVLNTASVGNLVLGLELAATVPGIGGRAFVIADEGGPTWREVFTELAAQLGARPPRLPLHPALATAAATLVEGAWTFAAPEREPPLTRYRASLMRNDVHFSLETSRRDLGYRPRTGWREALREAVGDDTVLVRLAGGP